MLIKRRKPGTQWESLVASYRYLGGIQSGFTMTKRLGAVSVMLPVCKAPRPHSSIEEFLQGIPIFQMKVSVVEMEWNGNRVSISITFSGIVPFICTAHFTLYVLETNLSRSKWALSNQKQGKYGNLANMADRVIRFFFKLYHESYLVFEISVLNRIQILGA